MADDLTNLTLDVNLHIPSPIRTRLHKMFAVNTEESWHKELFCITTLILPWLQLLKNRNLWFSFQILYIVITIFSHHLKMCYMGANMQTMQT
jgi:hypothetical protein